MHQEGIILNPITSKLRPTGLVYHFRTSKIILFNASRGIMPRSYHMDLRLKAIRMTEDRIGKSKISKMLCISQNTLWVSLCRKKETGSLKSKQLKAKKPNFRKGSTPESKPNSE